MRTLRLSAVSAAAMVAASGAAAPSPVPVQTTVPLGRGPCAVVVLAGHVWVANHRDGRIEEIDPKTNAVVWEVGMQKEVLGYGSLASAGGYLWIDETGTAVVRLDPRSRVRVAVRDLPDPSGMAVLGGAVWVSSNLDNRLRRIDPATAHVTSSIKIGRFYTTVLGAAAGGSLWLVDENQGSPQLVRVDPRSGKVLAQFQIGNPVNGEIQSVAVVGDSVWATQAESSAGSTHEPTLVRVDVSTNRIAYSSRPPVTGATDAFPIVLAPGDGTLWRQTGPASLSQLDPATGRVRRTVTIALARGRPESDYWWGQLAAGFGSYWLTVWPGHNGATDRAVGSLDRLEP